MATINLTPEEKQKVFDLVDERIKQLFEQGILKIEIEDVANNSGYMSYDTRYCDLQIAVSMNDEEIFRQASTIDIPLS